MSIPYRTYGTYWIIKPYIYSSPYFLMAAIAIIMGIITAYFEFKRRNLRTKHLIYMSIVMYLSMGVLGRIFYFFGPWSWGKYSTNIERIAAMFSFKSGMVFYGGLIGAILAVIIYTKIKRLNFWDYMDAWAPSAGIILFFARMGCFFAGCCFGEASSNLWWLLKTSAAEIHPTQLYSSFLGIVLFVILTELKYRQSIKKMFKGYVFLWAIIIYSAGRFLVEIIRFYEIRFMGLSASQIISIALFAICSIILCSRYKKQEKGPKTPKYL